MTLARCFAGLEAGSVSAGNDGSVGVEVESRGSEEHLGAADVDVAFQVLGLFVGDRQSDGTGSDGGAQRDEGTDGGHGGDVWTVRREDERGAAAQQVAEEVPLQADVEVCFGFFHGHEGGDERPGVPIRPTSAGLLRQVFPGEQACGGTT
ncbi:hypothetical protein IM697_23590 [Streptomyces ferrugineus]|uniref:Uncharacterized protein n=1 Tax=Streptomyces ferrugineus TaxID=1413221 RepID=A0A7M2SZ36_9ACTN|nr:hypothetical protein [Streptomyces ferrugineus]QOV41586.1 hypothetical protein IM697_23590 [Streptomyces ferrugineus]